MIDEIANNVKFYDGKLETIAVKQSYCSGNDVFDTHIMAIDL